MIEKLNAIGISDAMITSTVITVIICVLAIIAGRRIEMIPSGFQNMIELGIEKLHGFFEGIMGKYACDKYFPLIATLFIYILFCNYSGLIPLAGEAPGFQAPTSNVNFPAGMAIIVFFAVQIIGLAEHRGIRFYKHLFRPVAFIFPLMVIEEFVRPISLTFRLYGNIYGEEAVINSFFDILPLGLPIIMQALSVLMGLIQALVFSLLAAIYISEAAEHEEQLPVVD